MLCSLSLFELESARSLAKMIAMKSPVGIYGAKKMLNYAINHTVEDGLRLAATMNSALLLTKASVPVNVLQK